MADKDEHHYGGQAVIEGVMLRGKQDYAVAVRRADGPLIRGNYALYESLSLGLKSLQFSADVAMAEEQEKTAPASETDATGQPGLLSRILMALTMVASLALGIGLFVLLPAWVVDWLPGSSATALR